MNITSHVKAVIEQNLDPKIYLSAFNSVLSPNRSILFGPGHNQYPLKIKVLYTIPQ